jgi:hypothetical protein
LLAGRLSRLPDRLSLRAGQGGGGSPVRTPQLATRFVGVLAVPLLVAGVVAGVVPVAVSALTVFPWVALM